MEDGKDGREDERKKLTVGEKERLEEVKRERLEDGWWGRGVGEVRGEEEEVGGEGEGERGWKRGGGS